MKRLFTFAVVGMAFAACADAPVVRKESVRLYRPNGRNVVYVDYVLDGVPDGSYGTPPPIGRIELSRTQLPS